MKRLLILVSSAIIAFGALSFAENNKTYSYDDLANKLFNSNIIKGYSNDNFGTFDNLSKEDAVVILIRLLNKEDEAIKNYSKKSLFDDVPDDSFYAPYINYAKENKIILGKTNNIFGLKENVSTKEFITLCLRILNYNNEADWEKNPFKFAKNIGLLSEVQQNENEKLIRGEVFKIITNTLNSRLKNSTETLASKLNINAENLINLKNEDIKLNEEIQNNLDTNLTNRNSTWEGVGPNGEAENTKVLPYSRIPSVIIDKHGRIIVMFDLRWGEENKIGNDQARISTGVAISEDGGKTWNKFTAFDSDKTDDNNRRIMDSTMLYDEKNDVIYALHGMWVNGDRQWCVFADENWENDSWRAVIHKSTDHGYTWEEVTRFSKNDNTHIFENYRFNGDKKIIAFLGGVGTGIQTKDGTLVFPIQVTDKKSVNSSILYSKDDGKTWQLPDSENPFMIDGSSEHMVFELDGKLVSVGRGVSHDVNRHSYYSEDFGKTWKEYEPLNYVIGPEGKGKIGGAGAQGAALNITLPSGNEAVLLTQPKSKRGANWTRSDITLYVADGKNPKNVAEVVEFYPEIGDPKGSGYSSIYYRDGVLLVAYERQGDIYLKNLSEYIPQIEKTIKEFKK